MLDLDEKKFMSLEPQERIKYIKEEMEIQKNKIKLSEASKHDPLYDLKDQWMVYSLNDGDRLKMSKKTVTDEEKATEVYDKINGVNVSKILYHDKVVKKFGEKKLIEKCIDEAKKDYKIENIEKRNKRIEDVGKENRNFDDVNEEFGLNYIKKTFSGSK